MVSVAGALASAPALKPAALIASTTLASEVFDASITTVALPDLLQTPTDEQPSMAVSAVESFLADPPQVKPETGMVSASPVTLNPDAVMASDTFDLPVFAASNFTHTLPDS